MATAADANRTDIQTRWGAHVLTWFRMKRSAHATIGFFP
jgi:hypothetical protein